MERKLPDWIEGWMKLTENSEPPESFRRWTAISTIASALERKVWLMWDKLVYPNEYIVLVSPAGKARKGTAMSPARDMLEKLGINLAAEATTREALIRALKRAGSENTARSSFIDPETGLPRYFSALTIHSEELTVFLGFENRKLLGDLADWYDCRATWRYETKSQGVDHIEGVWVNLLGATTPELLQSTIPKEMIGSGLGSRIIFVYEEKKGKRVIFPFLTEEDKILRDLLFNDLQYINLMVGEFTKTEGFLRAWEKWYGSLDESIFNDSRLDSYESRRPTHLLKLSLIHSASRHDCRMEVTEEDFYRSLELLEKTERNMKRMFLGFGDNAQILSTKRVMDVIRREGSIRLKRLMGETYHNVSPKELKEDILPALAKMDFIKINYEENTMNPEIIFLKDEI